MTLLSGRIACERAVMDTNSRRSRLPLSKKGNTGCRIANGQLAICLKRPSKLKVHVGSVQSAYGRPHKTSIDFDELYRSIVV